MDATANIVTNFDKKNVLIVNLVIAGVQKGQTQVAIMLTNSGACPGFYGGQSGVCR